MDTQLSNYIILKNGESMGFDPRPLQNAIWLIQQLESGLDRLTQHSPYTISKA
jgi:hypothetical protein